MKFDLPYLVEDIDRHGNVRIYFKRRGFRKVRMRDKPRSPEFIDQYNELKSLTDKGFPIGNVEHKNPIKRGTWEHLCQEYLACDDHLRKDELTRKQERGMLQATWDEPLKPGSTRRFAQMPVDHMGPKQIKVLRDRKIETPGAARNRLKAISSVFRWAIESDDWPRVQSNPTANVARPKTSKQGYHTWTMDEVQQYQDRHKIGTKGHLALGLYLYTGVRRSDVVLLGPSLRRGDRFHFIAQKNRNRSPTLIDIPILPALEEILQASPIGDETYLITQHGKPFAYNGFGNWFRDRCVEAGLPHCSGHGLRKAGSVCAAENGATTHQLMAMFGWKSVTEAETYTKAAERSRLARSGMHLIRPSESHFS